MKGLFFILSLSFIWFGFGQNQKTYFVYFSDKGNQTYLPEDCLSDKAIERYELNNVSFTEQDYKVFPAYIDSIRTFGTIRYASKWLNGVIVSSNDLDVVEVNQLPFVDSVAFIGQENTQLRNAKFGRPTQLTNSSLEEVVKRKELLGIDALEKAGYNGKGVWVAVFDVGFQGVNTLPQFSALFDESRIVETFDVITGLEDVYVKHDHGTSSLGGIVGVQDTLALGASPNASIGLYVTEDISSEQPLEMYWWAIAMERADSIGYDIVSSSLGYTDFDFPFESPAYDKFDGHSLVISKMASIASTKGIVVVTSSGNFGNQSWRHLGAPADAKGIVSVGAVDVNGDLGSFSSVGPSGDGRLKPEVCGVGVRTSILKKNGSLVAENGTSYSAPQIAGVLASLKQKHREYTSKELIQLLLEQSNQFASPDNLMGYGVPNLTDLTLSVEEVNELNPIFLDYNYQVFNVEGKLVDLTYFELTNGFYIVHYYKGDNLVIEKFFKK